ncbi:hypothetical protein A2Z33_00080 [Candidatus Gottesmanbacteria bacterium RBG_16_52_11]|uniref:Phosphatidic acid phosphatase type 2/haloperoxidase domain-containing protein n=1 Tax=Candidatus Gottesmanbacteria bacterium RBG_16_52_11 TaxID=1798374 RepID=A0A1F5YN67_9BACT|nr:MAG: hypothetical protein A2Z33_00080 [Candidatus Gottesmanbacteria bacterium RBG_16_52_11]
MRKRLIVVFISGLLFVCFFLFSRSVRSGRWNGADFAVTVKIQERIDKASQLRTSAFLGDLMEGSVILVSPAVSTVAVLLLTAVASFDLKNRRLRWRGVLIPLAFAILVLAEVYGKTVVHHPAPPFFMIKNPTTHFPSFYVNEEFSYPSGHAARAAFLALVAAGLLLRRTRVRLRTIILLVILTSMVLFIGISKIYLGHHWASDIFGGVMVGSAIGLLVL